MSISMRSVVRPSSRVSIASRARGEEERAEQQVDAHDAQRLLLQGGLAVEHADVDDDLAGLIVGPRLELDPHPAVAFVGPAEAAGRDGVGEGEERRDVAAPFAQAGQVQAVFVVQHRLQAGPET